MATAAVNGQNIYFEDTNGRGPPLIFSHGFLLDREQYAPEIQVLRHSYRCVAWDQRGFGQTGEAATPFTYWDSAEDLLALMSALKIDKAILIGLSQGAFLSMRAALLAPDRVKGLVLISTRAGLDTPDTIANFRGLDVEWRENGSTRAAGGLADVLIGSGADHASWITKWSKMSKTALSHPIRALTERDDLTPRLAEIKCPALVLHGDADVAIEVKHGRDLAASLPNCKRFVEIAGAGHAPTLTHAPDLIGPLEEFVSEFG